MPNPFLSHLAICRLKYLVLFLLILIPYKQSEAQVLVRNRQEMLCNVDVERKYRLDNQEITLRPFELFDLVKLDGVWMGLTNTTRFSVLNSSRKIEFHDMVNEFEFDGEPVIDYSEIWKGKKVTFKLNTIGDVVFRQVDIGKTYKVIYAFKSDSEVHRTNIATEYADGYYIVDILPMNTPFPRQIPEDQRY